MTTSKVSQHTYFTIIFPFPLFSNETRTRNIRGEREKMLWKLRYSVRDCNYDILLPKLAKVHHTRGLPKKVTYCIITPKSMTYTFTAHLKKVG